MKLELIENQSSDEITKVTLCLKPSIPSFNIPLHLDLGGLPQD